MSFRGVTKVFSGIQESFKCFTRGARSFNWVFGDNLGRLDKFSTGFEGVTGPLSGVSVDIICVTEGPKRFHVVSEGILGSFRKFSGASRSVIEVSEGIMGEKVSRDFCRLFRIF